MAFGMNVVLSATTGGKLVGGQTNTYSSGSRTSIEESIPNGADQLVALVMDVTQIQSIVVSAPGVLTLEWNDNIGSQGSFVLAADVPYIWTTDSLDANQWDADVTALYVSNATGSAVVLNIEAIIDPTV